MSKLLPLTFGLRDGDAPGRKLSERDQDSIRKLCRDFAVPADLHESMLLTIQDAVNDFLLSRQLEDEGATFKEQQEYLRSLTQAIASLQPLLSAHGMRGSKASRAILQRAIISGEIDGDEIRGIMSALHRMQNAAATIVHGSEPSLSGRAANRARQVKLAKGLLDAFDRGGIAIERSGDDSLLGKMLGLCLELAGEGNGKPGQLIKDAMFTVDMGPGRRPVNNRKLKAD